MEQAPLTVTQTQVATVPGPVSTITITKTRVATIPGPMTTTTKILVERLTETFTTATPAPALTLTKSLVKRLTETETVTAIMGAKTSVPACTTRTLFEMATQTVTTTVERTAACTPVSCSPEDDKPTTRREIFLYIFEWCGLTSIFLIAWSFGPPRLDPSHEVLHLVQGDIDHPIGYDLAASDGIKLREKKTDNVAQEAPVDELLHSEVDDKDDEGAAEDRVAERDGAVGEDRGVDEVVGNLVLTDEGGQVADNAGVFEDTTTPTWEDGEHTESDDDHSKDEVGAEAPGEEHAVVTPNPIQEDRVDSESESDGSTEATGVEMEGDTAAQERAMEGGAEAGSLEAVGPEELLGEEESAEEEEESADEEEPGPALRGRRKGKGRGRARGRGRKATKK